MKISVIDSHTGGEPTRVVLPGALNLQGETMAARRDDFRARFDDLRKGLVLEPRGSEVWVGALLTAPVEPGSHAGVIFFNTVGTLGMCGHGTIGVVETLRHLGEVAPGAVRLDTPVGTVSATLNPDHSVTFTNVRSYRLLENIELTVPGVGLVAGDVSYGGNWFFLVKRPYFEISLAQAEELTRVCWAIRAELVRRGISGEAGAEIDHVELFSEDGGTNFVQCPGGAFDRSPCGTGTSAKLAGLFADGLIAPGQEFRQTSVTGSAFVGSVEPVEGGVIPTLTGRAYVIAESTLIFDEHDPIRWGLG